MTMPIHIQLTKLKISLDHLAVNNFITLHSPDLEPSDYHLFLHLQMH
jgi:hypothetical protein